MFSVRYGLQERFYTRHFHGRVPEHWGAITIRTNTKLPAVGGTDTSKQPFCVMNFRTTNKLFCSRLTDEPFSASSRCTVSSSTDCRNPTLSHDDKQCAFWNIAIRCTEMHNRFCGVTVQHRAHSTVCSFSTASIYLAITASVRKAGVFVCCCAHDTRTVPSAWYSHSCNVATRRWCPVRTALDVCPQYAT